MSYPQPNSDQYAVNGYTYFRLNTLLSSNGDIYESTQGAHAFALGPDGDIANVTIRYFDDQVPDFMNELSISPERTFVGLVGARNEVQYAPSGRPGRILIYPSDLYDSTFRIGIIPEDRTYRVVPRLDVIQYFTPEISVPQRKDRRWFFQRLPIVDLVETAFIFPYYGRKYACVRFTNFTGFNVDLDLRGINYTISPIPTLTQQVVIQSATVADGSTLTMFVYANRDGVFDALGMTFIASNAAFDPQGTLLSITTSDLVVDAQ